jgi:hypothetical protein
VEQYIAFRMERTERANGSPKNKDGMMFLDDVEIKELCRETYTVIGGGCYSGTGDGVEIKLSNSEADTEYELLKDGEVVTQISTGEDIGPISFGLFTDPGTYTVRVGNFKVGEQTLNCGLLMAGSAKVSLIQKVDVILTTSPFPVCKGVPTTYTAKVYLNGNWKDHDSNPRTPPIAVDGDKGTEVPASKILFYWSKNGFDGAPSAQVNSPSFTNSNLSSTDFIYVNIKFKDTNDPTLQCLSPPTVPVFHSQTNLYASNKIYLDESAYYDIAISADKNPVCTIETNPVKFTAAVTKNTAPDVDGDGNPDNLDDDPSQYLFTWKRTRGTSEATIQTTTGIDNNFIFLTLGEDEGGIFRFQNGDIIWVEMNPQLDPLSSGGCANASNKNLIMQVVSTTTWKGLTPDWFDPANWTACVPNLQIDAIIPATGGTVAFSPNILFGERAQARDLTVLAGGTVMMEDGGILEIAGNFTSPDNDDFAPNSTVIFSGNTAQQIAGSGYGILELRGSVAKVLMGNASVSQELNLAMGKIQLGSNNLTIQNGGSITGANASNYVITNGTGPDAGKLLFTNVGPAPGGRQATFPVGTVDKYNPATIKNDGEDAATFGVRVKDGFAETPTNNNEQLLSGIYKTWYVKPLNGAKVNVTLTLEWQEADEVDFDKTMAFLSHFEVEEGSWRRHGPFHDLTENPRTLTQGDITTFSPFAVGSGLDNLPLPVTLSFFQAEKSGSDVVLTWETASEQNNKGFGVEVSLDGESFRGLGFVSSKSANSQSQQRYSFRDSESGKHGTRYYRLRQTDLDGTVSYSATRAVAFAEVLGTSVSVFPNPFDLNVEVVIMSEVRQQARLVLTDLLGRVVYSQELTLEAGANRKALALDDRYSTGLYHLTTYVGERSYRTKLVKKQ